MQTRNPFIDDLTKVANGAMGALTGVKDEVEARVRDQIAKILDGMDIPRRDEFDAVKAMAAKAREENEELKKQIAELQAQAPRTRGRVRPMRVGVEVGGTFTDLVAVEGGRVVVTKVPSTPEVARRRRLRRADRLGHRPRAHRGSRPRLDRRHQRGAGAQGRRPSPSSPRRAFATCCSCSATTGATSTISSMPSPRRRCAARIASRRPSGCAPTARSRRRSTRRRSRAELIPALKAGGYRAVAICLLNAYANPVHEKRLAALIAEALPGVLVTCSHQVAREFREFERASTTLLSAYVQPVIDGYLHRFESKLADAGFKGRFTVMQSNGGRLPAEAMRQSAITALYSGPAAGVVGATRQAARSGYKDLITFDMGGTSTDVCLVQDGRPSLASESEIDGLPIRTPVLDIVSVGAGGGSIAWVDDGGMLRVGPQSAGADPGPACYGKGGTEPATTDAHIVIGTIRPGAFLGGRMTLDGEAARRAFEPLAERFGLQRRAGRLLRAAARRRQHRARHPARLDRARPRSARLCAGAVRRRGPAPCRAHRRGARHLDHRRAAQCRRDLGLWAGRVRLHQVRRRHAQDEARRGRGAAKPARPSPRCASGSPRSSPT